jgi:RHS repeat-associated protein
MRSIKIFFISLLGTIYSSHCFAQTTGTNNTRMRVPQIPITEVTKLDTIPVQRQAVSVQYSDALGRSLQSVQLKGSPNLNDIVVPYAYDNMGHSAKAYLPYAVQGTTPSNTGTYRSGALTDAVSFYNPSSPGAPKIPTDTAPFSQTVYEASPLGRVTEQGEVGAVSQPGTGHSVRASYQINVALDSILDYRYQPYFDVYYKPGSLTKTIVTDENGHRMALWKDLQGRTLTRTQLDAPSTFYSTNYVYNDLGQLSEIVTPWGKYRPYYDYPNYYFLHDSLGRVVEKKEPNKGWVYTVYNKSDQPVLSQDANMRAKNQWAYMKYDAEGRMVQTGIYTNISITSRKAMQNYCDNSFATLWETWQPGTGYTNNAFPTSSTAQYTLFYYDDYSFTEATPKPFQTNTYGTAPSGRTMGMLTGTSVYVLGSSSQYLATVNYYDKQNRLIQQIADNHIGEVDVVNNQYNFNGQLTGSERIIKPLHDTLINIKDRYVYDHMNRLMDTYESFRGAAEVNISHNVYSEIGQKVTEGLHATSYVAPNTLPASVANITENTTLTTSKDDIATNSVTLTDGFLFTATPTAQYRAAIGVLFAQTLEFRYNIKGWLTNINNGTLNNDGITQSDPNSLFGESITYYETSPLGAAAQYNGNISGITWRNKIEASGKPGVTTGGQGYNLSYDNLNRLTETKYYTQSGSSFTQSTTGALTESVTGYDEMGNILGLVRKDKSSTAINNLTYHYPVAENQLTSITDAGTQNITGTFTYDSNGNMLTDSKKNITITYNYLDLPDTVNQGSSKLVFTYDAAGNKLYKQLITSGTVVSQKHYIEDAEVTATTSLAYDGKVESIAMDEGRIVNTPGGYKYEYQLQDHLGNNRVRFRIKSDGTADLSQVQNYYPFGGDMGDTTMNYTTAPNNQYKYSGKELQTELNLDSYDFGARHYDTRLGRWMTMDPLGIISDELSPYNYVENNPMNMIDPDGMQPNGNWQGVPYASSGSGGFWGNAGGIGGSLIAGGFSYSGASNAFDISKSQVSTQSWNNLQSTQHGFLNPPAPVFNQPTIGPGSGFVGGLGSLAILIKAGEKGWETGTYLANRTVDRSLPMAISKILVKYVGIDHKVLFSPELDPYLTSKPHGNSDDNGNPHLVYEIYSVERSGKGNYITEKYGITGRQDRPYARPQYQVNDFNRRYPNRLHYWREIAIKPDRLRAKVKEVELVTKYFNTHREMPRRQIRPRPTD